MPNYHWVSPVGIDSNVQTYGCPYCDQRVAGIIHEIVKVENPRTVLLDKLNVYCIVECPVCHRPSIYEYHAQTVVPFAKALRTVKHVPEKVSAIYQEIRSGIGAKCYTSSVILSRTAIMHIAIEKGASDNLTFQQYVDFMTSEGYIPPNAKGWVDKIRTMSNSAVHHLEIWQKEDAILIGRFLMYLLIFVYELPSSIEAEER